MITSARRMLRLTQVTLAGAFSVLLALGCSQASRHGAKSGYVPTPMIEIPAGTFTMGSEHDQDQPEHEARMAAFSIDATEVTVAQYAACVDAGACKPPTGGVYDVLCASNDVNWNASDRPDHPMNCVPWDQAHAFCGWAGKRLPTEEEWEYAARGTDGRTYPWGNDPPTTQLCWQRRETGTCPAGQSSGDKSPFGVMDMAGNVSEWTATAHCESYAAPKTCSPADRIMRGGAFSYSSLHALRRSYDAPKHTTSEHGFRCAR